MMQVSLTQATSQKERETQAVNLRLSRESSLLAVIVSLEDQAASIN